MSRQARQLSETGYYHIIMRGNNKASIFKDNKDKEYFMNVLKQLESEEIIKLVAWCIMDNHVHIVMKAEKEYLSIGMKRINIKYAMHYHRVHQTVGHVFQDRYKSEVIKTEDYMMKVIRYVHMNPVKAKIVDTPLDYKWSSYQLFIGNPKKLNKEIVASVKNYFQNKHDSFITFHDKEEQQEYLEIKEDLEQYRLDRAQNIIEKYCTKYGIIEAKELKGQLDVLERLVKEIREECNLSLRKLSKLTEISVARLHNMTKQ
ncbi:MAG: REP-associated tyrosine transposase [Eubacteriaceae bacterium]